MCNSVLGGGHRASRGRLVFRLPFYRLYPKGQKNRAALALAVSLWIASGGVASASVYIDVTDNDTVKVSESFGPVEPGIGTPNVQELTASGNWNLGKLWGGRGSVDGAISGYKMIVAPGATLNGVYGGWNTGTGGATGNTVIIGSGATIGGNGVSGGTVYGGANATGNTVELRGATVNGLVQGGRTGHSSGLGNWVTGNTLVLSGANTVAGYVQNFQTIKLSDALAWKAGATVLNATYNHRLNFTNEGNSGIDKMTLDISAATNLKNATPGTMTLLSAPNKNNAFDGMPLKYFGGGTATLSTEGTQVFSGAASNAKNGVTLSYNATHTVKLEGVNNNTKNAVTYNVAADPVATVTLGAVAWSAGGTARDADGLTFNGDTVIDASGLTFTGTSTVNPLNQSMTLLSGATGITDGYITQPTDAGKGEVAVEYADANGVTLKAKAKGTVSVESSAVKYTINNVMLDSVNLSGWDSTKGTASVPSGWTKNGSGVSVDTGSTLLDLTTETSILTSETDGLFTGTVFSGVNGYEDTVNNKHFFASNTDKGVTLNGYQIRGIKASDDGKNLVYAVDATKNVTRITFDTMKWEEGRTADDLYIFNNVTFVDASELSFSFTNDQAGALATGSSMTLLSNAKGLAANETVSYGKEENGTDKTSHSQGIAYYNNVNRVAFSGTLTGKVVTEASEGVGTIKFNASSVTLDSVNLAGWDGETSTIPTGWTAKTGGVDVYTGDFTVPSDLAVGGSRIIFKTSTDGFFNTVVMGNRRSNPHNFSNDDYGLTGVTFSGKKYGGVNAEANGDKANANLTFYAFTLDTQTIDLGAMAWGKGRDANVIEEIYNKGYAYDFRNVGTVTATNLAFTFTDEQKAGLSADSEMTLLSDATNLAAGLYVTDASRTQAIDYAAGNGAALSGTLTGTVSTVAGAVKYEADSMTLDSVNLAGWDGAKSSTVPAGWTANASGVAVATENMTNLPNLGAGQSKEILTTDTANYFSDDKISETNKYKAYDFTPSEENKVTLSGKQSKGVRTSDDKSDLVYAVGKMDVSDVSFGTMKWGEGRAATADYDFANVATVNASALAFNFTEEQKATLSNTSSMALLANATNLAADKAVTGASRTQQVDYSVANGAALTGTLTGTVSTAAGAVNYAVTGMTLDSVNLAGWDSTKGAAAVPSGWTKNGSGVSVDTGSTLLDLTTETSILTSETDSLFTGAVFSGVNGYEDTANNKHAFASSTDNGVTLDGYQIKGIKATDDGKNLVYAVGATKNVTGITFGTMKWGEGRAATADYDFANVGTVTATGLSFTFTDEQKAALSDTGSMALLSNATNLAADKTVTGASRTQQVDYSVANGVALTGTLTGTVSTAAGAVNYAVTGMTLDSVNLAKWDGTTASAVPAGWTANATGTTVETDGMTVPTLDSGKHIDILQSNTADFFANATINGANTYKEAAFTENQNGITFAGSQSRGVTLNSEKNHLIYAAGTKDVQTATLSGEISWDTSKASYTNTQYTFSDSSQIVFAEDSMFTSATDPLNQSVTVIEANSTEHAVKGTISGTPGFTLKMNNTSLGATVTGAASIESGNLKYTVTAVTLDKVTVNSVGSDTVPEGWSTATDVQIDTESMTVPADATYGQPQSIMTSDKPIFDDNNITGSNKYGEKAFTDTDNKGTPGVTVAGTQNAGVKASADKKSLVYEVGKKEASAVTLGEVTWAAGTEMLDGSKEEYDYSSVQKVDAGSFVVKYDAPENLDASKGESMTLLKANATLKAVVDEEKAQAYSYSPVTGVTIDANIIGKLENHSGAITFTPSANQASKLTFGSVEWKDSGALMTRPANITFAGADVDTANIGFTNVTQLEANQKMTLVSDFGDKVGNITGTKYMIGTMYEGEGEASLFGNDLIFTTKTGAGSAAEQTHRTVMATEAGVATLAAGQDFVDSAVEGLGLAANMASDGTSTYASMGGGASRYKTGSHVDTRTWNAVVAVGSKRDHEKGSFEWGVFGEYGKGNYTLHNDDGGRGDGDTHYAGGGLLAKWTNKHNVYTEASFRMGRISDSASNILQDAVGNRYGYNVHATYFGGHVGVGKLYEVKKNRELDVYGKFFYTRRNGVSFNAVGQYDLDAVASSVLRVGAKYGTTDKKWNWYGGLAYEYEFDGQSNGMLNGNTPIRAASIKGGSVRGEIGMRMDATKTNPWKADISIYGYGGRHRGFGGNVSVAYMF